MLNVFVVELTTAFQSFGLSSLVTLEADSSNVTFLPLLLLLFIELFKLDFDLVLTSAGAGNGDAFFSFSFSAEIFP